MMEDTVVYKTFIQLPAEIESYKLDEMENWKSTEGYPGKFCVLCISSELLVRSVQSNFLQVLI